MLLVTGSGGFVGHHVVRLLRARGIEFWAPSHSDLDLADRNSAGIIIGRGVDRIIHLAANVGGIGYNQRFPADLFLDNIEIGATILRACRSGKIRRIVFLSTCCGFPHTPPRIPFVEEDYFSGMPEITNSGYGIARRSMLVGLDALHRQVGLQYAYLIAANMYGPGDNYDPGSSHVIPALIRRIEETPVGGMLSCWGTGSATRDFLYVEDCADAILRALEIESAPNCAINVGSGREVSIAEIVSVIVDTMGRRDLRIEWDAMRPDGQPRRVLDCSRARALLGWSARTALAAGLSAMIASRKAEENRDIDASR